MTRSLFALVLLAATSSAVAAPTSYVFDSVSKIDLGRSQFSITGILQGETTPTTVAWTDTIGVEQSVPMNRCVPMFLTMMEKPGRYLLNLRIDTVAFSNNTLNCGLELKN